MHSEDKNPSVNCKTVNGRRIGCGYILTLTSGSAIGSVRRSMQINAMLNVVPFSPGSNLDQESSSTAVANNGSDGAIVDGKDSSVKKDNGESSRRGRGKGNGSRRGGGKIKEDASQR
jgi:hypothetical protein